jgi:hypothetical protein
MDADDGAAESTHKYAGLSQNHAAIALVVSRVLPMVVIELYGAQEQGGIGDVAGESGFVVLAFLLGLGDDRLGERLPCFAAASHQCLWEVVREAQQDFCKAFAALLSLSGGYQLSWSRAVSLVPR